MLNILISINEISVSILFNLLFAHILYRVFMVGNLALGGFTCLNLQSIAQRNEELGNMIHSIDFSVLILGKKFVKVSCFRLS